MTRPGNAEHEPVRRLLLDAVPELRTPENRWERVAGIVGRRRRQRWAVLSSAVVMTVVLLGVTWQLQAPAEIPPTDTAPTPIASTNPTPSPSVQTSSPAPTNGETAAAPPIVTVRPPGVAYDPALIPVGWAGVDATRVTRTGAMPAANSVGAFRQVCQYSHMAPDDPVTAAGQPGTTPLMVFAGNTGAGAASTAASIAGSGNSTCWGGTADRSAYWTYALIDVRTGTPLAPAEFSVRYSANTSDAAQVRAMPTGLRLLADQATWGCWDGTLTTYDRPHACPPGKPLVLNIWFPRCWNGTQLDSPDHRSHLAYPLPTRCPASHPVMIPQLEYHVLYPAPADGDLGAWRLSNDPSAAGGPVVGYGGYFEGWVADVRQAWTDGCIRKPATCESHLIGDGRVIEGKGDL